MTDKVFENFLSTQHEQALALAAASDILQLEAEQAMPPQRYVARFHCRGLVRTPGGEITEANRFEVGIWLPDHYLDEVRPEQTLTILWPRPPWSIWHPNAVGPFICPGKLAGGTTLVDILFQIYEIITYQKWAAGDGLNEAACEFARANQHRFPIDRRPLKWKEPKP